MTSNDERPAVKFPAVAMAVTALSVLTALGTVAYFTVGKDLFSPAATSDAIPRCNSPEVRQLLAKIVSTNSNAFQTRTFIDFSDIVERSYTPDVKRYCAGYLTESGGKNYTGLELTLSSVGEVIGTLIPDYPRTAVATASPPDPSIAPEGSASDEEPDYHFLGPEELKLTPAKRLAWFRELEPGKLPEESSGEGWTAAELHEIGGRRIELFDSVRREAPHLITPADQQSNDEAEQEAKEYEP